MPSITASATDVPPSVSILEAHDGSIKGYPSAVSVAFSNHTENLSVPPSSQGGADAKHGFEMPPLPSVCEVSDSCADTIMKDANDASDHKDGATLSADENTSLLSPDVANENLNVAAENGENPPKSNDVKSSLLQILNGSAAPKFEITGSRSKILDEHRASKDDPPISISSRREAYKDALRQGILCCKDIEVSFHDFPYYLR